MAVPGTDLHVLDFTQGFVLALLGDERPSKAKMPRLWLVSHALYHLYTKHVICSATLWQGNRKTN
jgi:hypothetical protein